MSCFPDGIIDDDTRRECLEYCIGEDLDPESIAWIERWTDSEGDCIWAINQNLFPGEDENVGAGNPIPGEFYKSSEGLEWSTSLISSTFDKYRSQDFTIATVPGFPGYNSFQNTIYDICRSSPGICQKELENVCAPETTESLQLNLEKVGWCGCYMPDSEYSVYADRYQVPKQCTPMCARTSNIGIVGPSRTGLVECTQDVCVIDDVTINLAQTDISQGISFSQFCGGCSKTDNNISNLSSPSSSCICIIQNETIDAANTSIGGGIDLSQNCGDTRCFRTNVENTEVLPTSCTTKEDPFEMQQENISQKKREEFIKTGIIVISIVVFLLLLSLLVSFLDKS